MNTKPNLNLANLILESAAKNRGRIAIRTLDDHVSYDQLRDLIVNYALHMRQGGITRASCVALDSDHPIIATVVPIACSLLGCSWVRATPSALANPALGITHQLHDGTSHQTERRGILRITQRWSDPPGNAAIRDRAAFPGYANPARTWMIAQSSGTTGVAKCMAFSETIAWHRMFILPPFEQPEHPVSVTLFPPLSTPGLFRTLQNLAAGGTCLFRQDLASFREFGVHHVLGSPNHIMSMMRDASVSSVKIPYIMCGGGAIRWPMVARLLQHFEKFVYRYSSTEAANICNNIISHADNTDQALTPGRPQPGTRIRILSEDGQDLPPMQEGIVAIQSACVVSGYIGEPEESARVFRDGWFRPGDIGYLSEMGELFVTGRSADHLNLGGVKINPEIVDEIIQSHPGIREGACFALPRETDIDQFAAAVVIAEATDPVPILRSLEKKILDRMGSSRTPSLYYVVRDVPKNDNGKITRRALADAARGMQPVAFASP